MMRSCLPPLVLPRWRAVLKISEGSGPSSQVCAWGMNPTLTGGRVCANYTAGGTSPLCPSPSQLSGHSGECTRLPSFLARFVPSGVLPLVCRPTGGTRTAWRATHRSRRRRAWCPLWSPRCVLFCWEVCLVLRAVRLGRCEAWCPLWSAKGSLAFRKTECLLGPCVCGIDKAALHSWLSGCSHIPLCWTAGHPGTRRLQH